MIVIRTMYDLKALAEKSLLPKWYVEHLHDFFMLLFTALGNESLETFSLSGIAELVVLEAKDGFPDLRLPMIPGNPKFTELWPESFGKLVIDGNDLYRVSFMLDNERMLFAFSLAGQYSSEVEAWFKEQMEWSDVV